MDSSVLPSQKSDISLFCVLIFVKVPMYIRVISQGFLFFFSKLLYSTLRHQQNVWKANFRWERSNNDVRFKISRNNDLLQTTFQLLERNAHNSYWTSKKGRKSHKKIKKTSATCLPAVKLVSPHRFCLVENRV